MTPTQQILRNFIFCSIGGMLMAGCSQPLEEGQYCLNVEEGAECPSMETVNSENLPYEPACSTIEYVEATSEAEKSDTPYTEGMELVEDTDGDACCYKANYREIRSEPDCVLGRPLMEAGEAKIAELSDRAGGTWSKGAFTAIQLDQLSASQRAVAGRFYLKTALYEHASIASFQKYALDLMRFGAPPHLLDRAQQATRDEILHARMSFALATQLLGEPVQPGALEYTPVLCADLKTFARDTLIQGAIGETLAVLLAAEQLRVAKTPAVREFLQRVVEDESKHAELAWETLRWCVQQDSSIAEVLLEAIDAEHGIGINHYPEEALLELGLPTRAQMQKVITQGYTRVIIPSIHSLLEGHQKQSDC